MGSGLESRPLTLPTTPLAERCDPLTGYNHDSTAVGRRVGEYTQKRVPCGAHGAIALAGRLSENGEPHAVRPRDRASSDPSSDRRCSGGHRHRLGAPRAVWPVQGQSVARRPGPVRRQAAGALHRRDRHQPHPARRGQDRHHRRSGPGARAHRQDGHHLHPPTVARTRLRHQGWCGWRRLLTGHPDGGLQPSPDRRRARGEHREQPTRRVYRQPHLPRQRPRHRPVLDHMAPRRGPERP